MWKPPTIITSTGASSAASTGVAKSRAESVRVERVRIASSRVLSGRWGQGSSDPPCKMRSENPGSAHGVIKADADAFSGRAVRQNLMAQEAFPEEQGAGLGRDAREGLVLPPCLRLARRRGHHHGKARILETDVGGAFGYLHIIGPADGRMRMDMRRMDAAAIHHIDPERVQNERAAIQFKVERLAERPRMLVEMLHQLIEHAGALRQIVERGVGGVTL